jgi:hypothetical protein
MREEWYNIKRGNFYFGKSGNFYFGLTHSSEKKIKKPLRVPARREQPLSKTTCRTTKTTLTTIGRFSRST